jgi:hypothetical protein
MLLNARVKTAIQETCLSKCMEQRIAVEDHSLQNYRVNLTRIRNVNGRVGRQSQQVRSSPGFHKAEFVPSKPLRVVARACSQRPRGVRPRRTSNSSSVCMDMPGIVPNAGEPVPVRLTGRATWRARLIAKNCASSFVVMWRASSDAYFFVASPTVAKA